MEEVLQFLDQEKASLHCHTSMGGRMSPTLVTHHETPALDSGYYTYHQAFVGEQVSKLIGEVIATVKDDRMNTKRSISADIASTARVQNHSEHIIDACKHELRRRELTEEQRSELLDKMTWAAESSIFVNKASREFQREQLDHSHKLPWVLLGGVALLLLGGIGGATVVRAMA